MYSDVDFFFKWQCKVNNSREKLTKKRKHGSFQALTSSPFIWRIFTEFSWHFHRIIGKISITWVLFNATSYSFITLCHNQAILLPRIRKFCPPHFKHKHTLDEKYCFFRKIHNALAASGLATGFAWIFSNKFFKRGKLSAKIYTRNNNRLIFQKKKNNEFFKNLDYLSLFLKKR